MVIFQFIFSVGDTMLLFLGCTNCNVMEEAVYSLINSKVRSSQGYSHSCMSYALRSRRNLSNVEGSQVSKEICDDPLKGTIHSRGTILSR